MDGSHARRFFLEPQQTFHRQYEALRAVFVEDQPLEPVAERFGYKVSALRSMASRFRADRRRGVTPPFFSRTAADDPAGRRRAEDRPAPRRPRSPTARELNLAPGRTLHSRVAGVFLFLPLLARLGFDRLVAEAGYPGSEMVPATSALLSLLALKLLDKERRSHIDDFNCDEALGLFAGLNILPKKSFATDYSYRAGRDQQLGLLQGWVKALAPVLFPEPEGFSLDFHPIPYRGDPAGLDRHYLPLRGKAGPSVLTFFALEQTSRCLCYANANLTRADSGRRADAVRRVLARGHRLRPQVALLRHQGGRLPRAVARQPTEDPLRHHPPPRDGHPPAPGTAARFRLEGGRDRHPQTLSHAHPLHRGDGAAARLRRPDPPDRRRPAWAASGRRCSSPTTSRRPRAS